MLKDSGNGYKLDDGVLMSTTLHQHDAPANNWIEVDFERIDAAEEVYCMRIRDALIAQLHRIG